MTDRFAVKEGVYPKHIYDPVRIEIAISHARHELAKNLHGFGDHDVDTWFDKLGPRDFWNGVHGIAMGFKLKNGMMQNITAENVSWRKEDFPLEKLHSEVDGKKWPGQSSVAKHPIIILRKRKKDGSEYHGIYDGHRRASLAIFDEQEAVPAFVGEYDTDKWRPQNFWLPTSFLMDLVENGEYTGDYGTTLNMLRKLIKLSESGAYELRERVLVGENKFRMRLKKDLF